ncbi:hypothetical protein [Streptomyces sp. CB01881]|uniref:hypothetical protein n=1 Tax=Streptomyces sp. CB01881 TaxID=2078691 RepID=UPI000CDC8C32|nr:hypothetical protein [Streptomyces sp. CB01881]AUY53103.1 hypothetical protein C2142_34025 [Streptomyces sp. CB01881]TYC70821.1 hypothetical protein EH183_34090 [Streptomyces sp. CB01881]
MLVRAGSWTVGPERWKGPREAIVVERELCDTSRHLIVRTEPEDGAVATVTWGAVLRFALWGFGFMAVLSGILFAFVGVVQGSAVPGITAGLLVACAVYFAVAGHRLGCAAKKALVTVFGWWEYVF